jgi:hypothetical protein
MPPPKDKHLKHLGKKWINQFVDWTEHMVKNHRIAIYISSITILCISIIGIFNIVISGSIIEDMPKKTEFFSDI